VKLSTTESLDGANVPVRRGKAQWLKQVRQLHLYLGTFFAPAIIFFSLTGALQLFNLHEGHPGEAYQPPQWIEKLASLHKKQNLAQKREPPRGIAQGRLPGGPGQHPPNSAQGRRPDLANQPRGPEERGAPQDSRSTLALKWFFLFMSLGLVATTCLGIYMAFKYNRSRALVWSLLLLGAAVPGVLIALQA
jgi:hypothetical protein